MSRACCVHANVTQDAGLKKSMLVGSTIAMAKGRNAINDERKKYKKD